MVPQADGQDGVAGDGVLRPGGLDVVGDCVIPWAGGLDGDAGDRVSRASCWDGVAYDFIPGPAVEMALHKMEFRRQVDELAIRMVLFPGPAAEMAW